MKSWIMGLMMVLSLFLFTGCGGGEAAAAAPATTAGNQAGAGPGQGQGQNFFQSAYLTNEYEGALPPTMQLSLGALQLEGSDQAVTAEQAKKLLPLWQALQSGAIQNGAERNAVYKQIEGALNTTQMQAIAEMKLTFEDLTAWAKANGIELPEGGFGQGGGAFANLSEEERTKLRAELQNMTPEQRQARLRELGIEFPQGGQGGQGGQNAQGGQGGQRGAGGRFNVLNEPLIKLLAARAAQQ